MGLFPGSIRLLGDASAVDVVLLDANGVPVVFSTAHPANAVTTEKTMTAVTQLLAGSNPLRRQLIVENQTNKVLYLAFAVTATPATRVVSVPVGGMYQTDLNGYTGDVSGILAGAPSSVNKIYVTEVTQ